MTKKVFSPETIAKWRANALRNQPWKHSTGPKTPEGKARVALNGKSRQRGELSYRETFKLAKEIRQAVREIAARRREAEKLLRSQRSRRAKGEVGATSAPCEGSADAER